MKPQHLYDQTSQTLVSLKFYADTSAYGLSNLQPVQVYYASMSYDFFFQERGKCFDSALQPCFDSAPYFDKLNNHLGNVLTVISDKRMLVCNADTVTYSYASIISATDYSPFGATLAGRTFSSESYRFRFNGKENDSETYGDGNALDFGARIYDSRLGRWMSVDPYKVLSPHHSPYCTNGNNPIYYLDLKGNYFTGYLVNLYNLKGILCKAAAKGDIGAKYYLSVLQRMEDSEIEFHLTEEMKSSLDATKGVGGKTGYDIENGRIIITVYDFINGSGTFSYYEKLIHELEHGRQFMDKEIEFATRTLDEKVIYSGGIAYDKTDEFSSFVAQSIIRKIETGKGYSDDELFDFVNKNTAYMKVVSNYTNSTARTIKSLMRNGFQVYSAWNTISKGPPSSYNKIDFSISGCLQDNEKIPLDNSIKGDSNDPEDVQFLD